MKNIVKVIASAIIFVMVIYFFAKVAVPYQLSPEQGHVFSESVGGAHEGMSAKHCFYATNYQDEGLLTPECQKHEAKIGEFYLGLGVFTEYMSLAENGQAPPDLLSRFAKGKNLAFPGPSSILEDPHAHRGYFIAHMLSGKIDVNEFINFLALHNGLPKHH